MHISIRGLKKTYFMGEHAVPVLGGIDLDIRSGELCSLTGPSGVGKSTLLHIIGTLDTPSGGEVLFDNQDVFRQSPADVSDFRNQNVGFVFQFHHLLPEFTAIENVAMPVMVGRGKVEDANARARALLEQVGLAHRMTHRPGELSGGEQQRVALARALVNEPRLLLADEPTGNLDEATGAGIHEVIEDLNRQKGITVILVTHNPRLAKRMPRQIRLSKDGIDEDLRDAPPATSAAPASADAATNVS